MNVSGGLVAVGSGGLKIMGDGNDITFGDSNEIVLTHVHDTGLLLTDTGGSPTLQLHDSNESVSSVGTNLILTSGGPAFKMPTSDGTGGHFLKTDGSGNLSFAAASGGGGGGVTVQDEGSALSTTATTLNFVGDGVVASGTGGTKTITINTGSASTEVYIAESADGNAGYNVPFMNVTGAGGGSKGLLVDNASFGFNPSTHTLFLNNLSTLSSADFLISAAGQTCRGIGYFKFTTQSASASHLLLANVAIGYSAGSKSANPATSSANMRNVFVGSLAGLNQTSGQFNTYVALMLLLLMLLVIKTLLLDIMLVMEMYLDLIILTLGLVLQQLVVALVMRLLLVIII